MGGTTDEEAGPPEEEAELTSDVRFLAGGWNHRRGRGRWKRRPNYLTDLDKKAGPPEGEAELASAFSPVGGTTDEGARPPEEEAELASDVRFRAGGWNHRRGSEAARREGPAT